MLYWAEPLEILKALFRMGMDKADNTSAQVLANMGMRPLIGMVGMDT